MKLLPAANGWYCPDDPGEPGLGMKRWSVNANEARIVSELLRSLDVLEIGTGLGVSTRAIAKKAHHVHTVDIDPWVAANVELPENATFYTDISEVPMPLDAAFIDGLHSREQCVIDIADARRVVMPGGLIVLHDARMPSIRGAIIESKLMCWEILTEAGLAFGWNE